MKKIKTNLLLFLIFVFCPLMANAIIGQTISYQGFLIGKSDNLPVNTPQDINFVFFNADTAGTEIYSEGRCKVGVLNGRYEVEIGSTSSGGITDSLFIDNPNIWLEVQIDPDNDCSGTYEPLQPRIRMQASPYAFNSLYASTASAATPVFSVDVIGTLDNTTNGAVTISSNLYVMGGISVGDISPGQTLAVAGIVESSTGGFKFPDGTLQITAAGETKWGVKVRGDEEDLYTLSTVGNIGLGTGNTPLAKLHISSGAGESGNIFVVSTGVAGSFVDVFRVTGESKVYADSFYGYLMGAASENVLKTGDTMTGQLTVLGSSLTIINSNTSVMNSIEITTDTSKNTYHFVVSTIGYVGIGRNNPAYRLHVDASSGTAGTILAVSTGAVNIFEVKGNGDVVANAFHGDGSGLNNIVSEDSTKILKTGDTMTGNLTISGSSLTVTDDIYSSLSLTSGGEIYGSSITVQVANINQALIASSGTFTTWGPTQYSLETTSGILVNNGIINAPYYVGDGSLLVNVTGTDDTKLLKAGDIMTGKLGIEPDGAEIYSLSIATGLASADYSMVVTTQGNMGIQVAVPSVPLEVYNQIKVSHSGVAGPAILNLYSNAEYAYIRWSDTSLEGEGNRNIGILSADPFHPTSSWDLVYRAAASNMVTGVEVFRIKSDKTGNEWKFGIGTNSPVEKFHVDANTLFGPSLASPVLYVSTTNAGVGIATTAITHKLTVDGGIVASSSITASGGFYGDILTSSITLVGNLGLGVNDKIAKLEVRETGNETYTVLFGTNPAANSSYDMVVTTQGNVGIGVDSPEASLDIYEQIKISNTAGSAGLYIDSNLGDGYISWYDDSDHAYAGAKGILGYKAGNIWDLTYRSRATNFTNGTEIFRAKDTGNFGIGVDPSYRLHVSSAAGEAGIILAVSTGAVNIFEVKGNGDVVGGQFIGNGSNLTGIVTETNNHTIIGDLNLTGDLTLTGSTLTVTGNAFSVATSVLVVDSGEVGIGTATPGGTLDVNGNALFGSGANKSSFTVEGYWQPRWLTTSEVGALQPTALGQVIGNSSIFDLCISTGMAATGQWALVGSKGTGNCY
jgi:hypothetical protein